MAVPPEALKVTVVAVLAGWSRVAVTVTSPSSSGTLAAASDTLSVVGSGFSTVAVTESTVSGDPYSPAEPETACVIADSPVVRPDTVKVFSVSQSSAVKVTAAGATVATPGVPLDGVIVTCAVGWLSSTTV